MLNVVFRLSFWASPALGRDDERETLSLGSHYGKKEFQAGLFCLVRSSRTPMHAKIQDSLRIESCRISLSVRSTTQWVFAPDGKLLSTDDCCGEYI